MIEVVKKGLNTVELDLLEQFGNKIKELGFSFAVFNCGGEICLLCESGTFTKRAAVIKEAVEGTFQGYRKNTSIKNNIVENPKSPSLLTAVIKAQNQEIFVVVLDTTNADQPNDPTSSILKELLHQFKENFNVTSFNSYSLESVSLQLSKSYEELALLYKLSSKMTISDNHANFLQMSCDGLTDIVLVEGIALFLETEDNDLVLTAGSGIIDFDDYELVTLKSRLSDEIEQGKESLVDSEVDGPLRYQWPELVKNILAVPIYDNRSNNIDSEDSQASRMAGILVGINRINKPDFDSPDAKLFNSVANSCSVYIRNTRLFTDLKEMFMGTLKALASTIDAKDHYTRGHSERVAFISKWIADLMPELTEKEVNQIYLAGLLHDIGKLGIDDSILRCNGRLDEGQFECLKAHPAIGAGILSDMKQMSEIVPGILYHHERIDGNGYPNAVQGDQIPVMGKILCVADSFDAMTSDRVYRKALTLEQALDQIRKNLGAQFDERIGTVFLDSDIDYLYSLLKDEEQYVLNSLSANGYKAVGGLIR